MCHIIYDVSWKNRKTSKEIFQNCFWSKHKATSVDTSFWDLKSQKCPKFIYLESEKSKSLYSFSGYIFIWIAKSTLKQEKSKVVFWNCFWSKHKATSVDTSFWDLNSKKWPNSIYLKSENSKNIVLVFWLNIHLNCQINPLTNLLNFSKVNRKPLQPIYHSGISKTEIIWIVKFFFWNREIQKTHLVVWLHILLICQKNNKFFPSNCLEVAKKPRQLIYHAGIIKSRNVREKILTSENSKTHFDVLTT